jgi:cobyrinic acid a,c-diamide synthase
MIPRLVIAGTHSGVGKTTFIVGLCGALRLRGMRVAMFKCGPDYLDPTYHVRAAGARSLNLDGWMMGRDGVLSTFQNGAKDADIALIEGVMGLFDGAEATSEIGSTAEIAKWLSAPVLLVVDASGMSRSIAALAAGFASFDAGVHLAGLICNRIGGKGHLDLLAEASPDIPVLGGLPKDPESIFPERHLGLHTADETSMAEEPIRAWAAHVANWCNVDKLIDLAHTTTVADPMEQLVPPTRPLSSVCRIGIARDEAFHFYYDENVRLLEDFGAELIPFSPMRDKALPQVDGLYLGGGYPELHAEALEDNVMLRRQIWEFCSVGKPVYAECGGLMYLCSEIQTSTGISFPMVSWFPAVAVMSDRLQALGYVEATTQKSSILGDAGETFRGHQFRYSTLVWKTPVENVYDIRKRRNGDLFKEGYSLGNVIGSYVHSHWASNRRIAGNFVEACRSKPCLL